MSQSRTVECDIPGCVARQVEAEWGDGFPGWGQMTGVALNGSVNPNLCPEHLKKIMGIVDSLEGN